MIEMKGETCIVTGSNSGIGKETALALAKMGATVVMVVRNPERGEKARTEIIDETRNEKVSLMICDLSSEESIHQFARDFRQDHRRLDVLVNNAGITIDRLVTNMSPQDWQSVINVNLTGVFNCTKAVIPHMIEAGGGKIINMSSQGALDGPVGQANYAAAKGGVISLTKVVAREYGQYNILCNAIAPGLIHTKMTDAIPPGQLQERVSKVPLGRRGEPEEVARLIGFLAEEDNYINGQVLLINAGEYI